MADATERVIAAEQRIGRWRRRTVLLVVAVLAIVGVGAAWAMSLEDGPWVPPLEHGGGVGPMRCPTAPSRAVADTFGGGGQVLDYVDTARCEVVISITNPTDDPVEVLSVERTSPDSVVPIRLVGATRARKPASAPGTRCHGCAERFVEFSPMTIAPGDEWDVAIQGVMDGCRAFEKGEPYKIDVQESVGFRVEVDGETRPVTVFLEKPWAVRSAGCNSTY